jgi:NAD(P)-dependent dehydrogenase (short-subunit alcohol dehydrogenase family)
MNVLITGANRGLGLEFVKQYAEEGAMVFACCRDPREAPGLRKLSDASGGKISLHALEVTSDASVAALAASFAGHAIDLLINNAGVSGGPPQQTPEDVDLDAWLQVFAVNTIAPLRVARAFKANLKAGHDKKLVTITSMLGSTAMNQGGYLPYRASKAAVNNVMHGLAATWKDDGITIALLHPGWVKTDMGGPSAPVEPHDSIAGMRKVIAGLKPADSGKFIDFTGKELPW